MTTFITGGTTSLGRVLVKELVRQGEALRILVRPDSARAGLELPGVAFVRGDITDPVAVRKGLTGCDRICHLAGVTGRRHTDSEVWRANLDGTTNVLQAALDMRVASVVQVSSIAALGPVAGDYPVDERRFLELDGGNSVFEKSRLAADEAALEFAQKGVNVKVVYPGFGFGYATPYGQPGFAAETLLQLAADKSVALVGNEQNRICLSYYKDTAAGIQLAHENGRSGESYILGGNCLSLGKIWAVIAEVVGKTPPTRKFPRWMAQMSGWFGKATPYAGEYLHIVGKNWNYTSQKARQELGWQPLSLFDAMAETWADHQAPPLNGERKRVEPLVRKVRHKV